MAHNDEQIKKIICDSLNLNCNCRGAYHPNVYGNCVNCWSRAVLIFSELQMCKYVQFPLSDEVEAIQKVKDAWNDPGNHPPAHQKAMSDLHETWPTLARAVENLANQ